jgi:hypothetical protein
MWREPDSPQSGTENTEIETIINPSVSSVPFVVGTPWVLCHRSPGIESETASVCVRRLIVGGERTAVMCRRDPHRSSLQENAIGQT